MQHKQFSILLLEDDATLAYALGKAMTKRGHRMHCASNISEFEQLLGTGAPEAGFDVILMDLKLETESSLNHIAYARAACPQAKIIMITGYASIATTVEAIKQGADDYLPKPVTADDILRICSGTLASTDKGTEILSPKRLEWEHIQRVLQENAGNISKTAEQLNMHRRTLQRKLQKKPQQQ